MVCHNNEGFGRIRDQCRWHPIQFHIHTNTYIKRENSVWCGCVYVCEEREKRGGGRSRACVMCMMYVCV